jgi:hypothetical protein
MFITIDLSPARCAPLPTIDAYIPHTSTVSAFCRGRM